MTELRAFQIAFSTAEVEASYFTGVESTPLRMRKQLLPEGEYRVVAGELFRVVGGAPLVLQKLDEGDD